MTRYLGRGRDAVRCKARENGNTNYIVSVLPLALKRGEEQIKRTDEAKVYS